MIWKMVLVAREILVPFFGLGLGLGLTLLAASPSVSSVWISIVIAAANLPVLHTGGPSIIDNKSIPTTTTRLERRRWQSAAANSAAATKAVAATKAAAHASKHWP